MQVAGWALDNKGISSAQALIDGQPAGALNVGLARSERCVERCVEQRFGLPDRYRAARCEHLRELRCGEFGPTRVGARATIGANATIVCGEHGL